MDVSVVIAIHPDDGNHEFKAAIESLLNQTLTPDELLIVYDEYIRTKQQWRIEDWTDEHPETVTPIEIPSEKGRGAARARGVEAASNELIAIQDADDVSVKDRLEDQAHYLDASESIDVVGGYIAEYDSDLTEQTGVRRVPTYTAVLKRMAKVRCPMNHPTVMFRRSAVLDAGNYRDLDYGEDWGLWLRMLQNGSQLSNIPTVYVKARTDEDWHDSRGPSIALDEIRLQRQFVRDGTVHPVVAAVNLGVRLPIRLAPSGLRETIYSRFLRQNTASATSE